MFGERGRYGVADLLLSRHESPAEQERIGEPLQAGHLPHRQRAVLVGMYMRNAVVRHHGEGWPVGPKSTAATSEPRVERLTGPHAGNLLWHAADGPDVVG